MISQLSSRCVGSRSTCRSPLNRPRLAPVRSLVEPRPSIDPLSNRPRAASASPGTVYSVFSAEEVNKVLAENKDRLVVIMCKASHCKPCKTFMAKYHRMAELLPDTVLVDIVGDTNTETKQLMVQWGVKSTPNFRLYRDGECVGSVTGAKEAKILPAITEVLREGERGRSLQPEDLEEETEDDM